MNVTILYNRPTFAPDHPDYEQEAGVLESVTAFRAALESGGHWVAELGLTDSVAPLLELADRAPDVVVNFCEALAGETAAAPLIAQRLEQLGIPFTGSPSECLALERDKAHCKQLFRDAGLPTAPFVCLAPGGELPLEPLNEWLAAGPLFVKPAAEDASLGITQQSVVENRAALQRQTAEIVGRYGNVLIEPYIDGREFNIGIVALPEPQALPLAEIEFQTGAGGLCWPIVSYQAKWDVEGPEDRATPVRCPADVEPALAQKIADAALAAFRLIGCRDYARVDLRVDRAGQIFLLEVNANPDAGPRAGLARALQAGGIDYNQFVERLVATAAHRRAGHA